MIRGVGPIAGLVTLLLVLSTTPVIASAEADLVRLPIELTADLEGSPIPLAAVAKFACHDLDYPAIHCFASARALDGAVQVDGSLSLLSGIDYVQVWENTGYTGATMVMSQDYPVLAAIGWNDRISSFKGRNSQTGTFFTDWFGGGTAYGFCCNQQVASLGGFNNTFSSVYN